MTYEDPLSLTIHLTLELRLVLVTPCVKETKMYTQLTALGILTEFHDTTQSPPLMSLYKHIPEGNREFQLIHKLTQPHQSIIIHA